MDVLLRLASGTDGDLLTVSSLNAATLGAATGWVLEGGIASITHTKVKNITPINLPTPFSCGGQTVSALSKAIRFDLASAKAGGNIWEGVQLNQSGNFASGVKDFVGVYILQPAAVEGTNNVSFDLISPEGGGFGVPQFQANPGQFQLKIHTDIAGGTLAIVLDPAKTYMVTSLFSDTEGVMTTEVTDLSSGQSVGAIKDLFHSSGLEYILFQDYLNSTDIGGGSLFIPLVALRLSGDVFPLRNDYSVPVPSGLAVNQLAADKLTLTFSQLGIEFEVFRAEIVSGVTGAYSSLETSQGSDFADALVVGASTWEDVTVTDGHTYLYRVYAKMRGYTSAVAQSASKLVDNGPFATGAPIVTGHTGGFELSGFNSGFKFTWNTTNKSCVSLGFTPSDNTFGDAVITVRKDSDGTVMGTVTISGPYTSGVEIFADLATPFTLVNGTAYRLTPDDVYALLGFGTFTFSSNITSIANSDPDGVDQGGKGCVNLLFV